MTLAVCIGKGMKRDWMDLLIMKLQWTRRGIVEKVFGHCLVKSDANLNHGCDYGFSVPCLFNASKCRVRSKSRDSRLLLLGVSLCSWGDDTHDTYDTSDGLPHATHDACDARDDATSAHDAGTHATYQCPGRPGFAFVAVVVRSLPSVEFMGSLETVSPYGCPVATYVRHVLRSLKYSWRSFF